jgi:hypothetical protein
MLKQGRISKTEEEFIEKNIHHMDYKQLAEKLERDPDSVNKFIKRKFKIGLSDEEEAAFELEDRPYFENLKEQFTEKELELFKYHWSRVISQFKDDVIPTEELQVVDLIKLELLMNRCLINNKENESQISSFKVLLDQERAIDADQQNKETIFSLQQQITSLKASSESLNRDYRELQTKKNSMLKEMKATREQRVQRIQDGKQTFTGWLTYLMTNPEKTREYGLEMEKMRMAMLKEQERLSQYHKYEDGEVDQPFLNSETVKE